ncbi:MAG: hypothetical protein OHK0015_46340 [Chloroflexi bacterium OHK40]
MDTRTAEMIVALLARLELSRQPLTDRAGLRTLLQHVAEGLAELSGTGVAITVAPEVFEPPLMLRLAVGEDLTTAHAHPLIYGGVVVATAHLRYPDRLPVAESLLLRVATEALAELRAAEASVRAAEERTRRILAAELHDHVKQVLPAIRLLAERAERDLARDPASAALLLREIREAAQQGLDDLAFLLGGMRGQRAGQDLLSALERLLTQVGRVSPQLAVTAELVAPPLSWECAACMLGIARSALVNVLQHAGAGTVRVRLTPVDGEVLLEISDDGIGAHLEAALAAPGIGLESVLERVESRGGRAEISTAPGQGTTIRVWLPAEREE